MKRFFSTILLCCFFCTLSLPAAQAAEPQDLKNHWSAGEVKQLIARGAVGGYPDGTFHPDASITRAEFSKILRQSLGLSAVEGNDFSDTVDHWAVTDIHTLAANQILIPAEYGNQYGPDYAITRREIAIMMVRAMGLNDSAVTLAGQATAFSDDASLRSYDKGYLYLAKELGLVGGYEDGSFQPNNKATRAEACVMIVRLLNLKNLDHSTAPPDVEPDSSNTIKPENNPAANSSTNSEQQSNHQVQYQMNIQSTTSSARNHLQEQYIYASLQLTVKNNSAQPITVSNQQLKTIVTYNGGAQVTASQAEFMQTIDAGQSKTITTTVNILLPNNQVANLVLGNQISDVQVQVHVNNQVLTFPEISAALLKITQ